MLAVGRREDGAQIIRPTALSTGTAGAGWTSRPPNPHVNTHSLAHLHKHSSPLPTPSSAFPVSPPPFANPLSPPSPAQVRPLTVSYMEDSTASSLSRGGACLLRCFPHEWSVLADPSRKGSWSYVGRFDARPSPTQLEKMLMAGMTDLRNRRYRDNAAAAERERGGLATGGEGPSAP